MVTFTAIIRRFGQQGEKTGWSFLEVPAEVAEKLKPGTRKSYRVKGKLDNYKIEQVSLLPMGEGNFIIPLNAAIRKGIKKNVGATVKLQLAEDKREMEICPELVECLQDEPAARKNFEKLPPSHQRYYSKWILSAKTEETKAKRIAKTIEGLIINRTFGETMKS